MKKVILLLAVAFGLMSCEEVVQLDIPDTPPRIVVNGRVTDTLPVEVQVFATAPYFAGEVPGVADVSIILFENGTRVDSLIQSDTTVGYYYGSHIGSFGNIYSLSIEVFEGNEHLEAGEWITRNEEIKRCPPIDSFYSEYRESAPFQEEGYYVAAHFTEPAGVGDNYRIRAWRNDSLQNRPFDLTFFEDEFSDGLSFGTPPVPALTVDGPRPVGTTYKIELASITRDYFDFLAILQQQTVQVGSPFDPPPAAIVGNIYRKGDPEDYALGFFNASTLQYAETVIVE
ncbi:MAG: DUF4249 domain-containing protein [Flavobacteriia bacterium]|nr:DUF4249 domain-containing protein [Flavobacteriia bacterium]